MATYYEVARIFLEMAEALELRGDDRRVEDVPLRTLLPRLRRNLLRKAA